MGLQGPILEHLVSCPSIIKFQVNIVLYWKHIQYFLSPNAILYQLSFPLYLSNLLKPVSYTVNHLSYSVPLTPGSNATWETLLQPQVATLPGKRIQYDNRTLSYSYKNMDNSIFYFSFYYIIIIILSLFSFYFLIKYKNM